MEIYFALFLIAGAIVGFIYLQTKYPAVKNLVGHVKWFLKVTAMTIKHFELDKRYLKKVDMASSILKVTSSLSDKDRKGLLDGRTDVAALAEDVFKEIFPGERWDPEDRRVFLSSYVFILSREDFLEVLGAINKNHKDLDVRKATNLAIDVMGEFINLEDRLGKQYIQHLIIGINRSLVLIKKNGTDKRTLKKVTSTLYRTWKLTKAYRYRRGLQNLTEAELYATLVKTLYSLNSAYSSFNSKVNQK